FGADKQMRWLPVSFSLTATLFSALAFLGTSGDAFAHGLVLLWGAVAASIAMVPVAFIFVPVYYDLNIKSISDYLGQRYESNYFRMGISCFISVQTSFVTSITLYSASLAFSTF